MRRLLGLVVFVCFSSFSYTQEILIKDFHHRFVTTELSAKQAIQQAIKEALTACVQENLGTMVLNMARIEKQEKDKKYTQKYNSFTQLISNGYVRRYVVKDTILVHDELSLDIRVILDITLYKPKNDDEMGLNVTCDKFEYTNEESAQIAFSVKRPAYIYLLDLTFNNEFCLLHETKEKIPENTTINFPEKKVSFELSMVKEDKSDMEFGSFVVIASEKPINFGISAADISQSNCSYFDFNVFFSIISGIKKDYSLQYLPYCIE